MQNDVMKSLWNTATLVFETSTWNGQHLAILFVFCFLLGYLLSFILQTQIPRFLKILKREDIPFHRKNFKFLGPFFIFIQLSYLLKHYPFSEFYKKTPYHIIFTLGVVMGLHVVFSLLDLISFELNRIAEKSANKVDDLIAPIFKRVSKILVFIFAVAFLMQGLGVNVAGVLAGLGIGGLAIALAAKDTLSNLFGSITVLLDRPFEIGDAISINGIEGSVVEVGLRSTRIKTYYDSVITLPNSQLTSTPIDNYGKRTYRRFSTTLGVEYSTSPEKIEAFCEGIRQIILAHDWTRKDYFNVYLYNFSASSLDIMLYMFWKVPDRKRELTERHRLLIDIMRLAQKLEVNFAFPTQTLHVHQENHKVASALDPHHAYNQGKEKAIEIINAPISMKTPRSGQDDF